MKRIIIILVCFCTITNVFASTNNNCAESEFQCISCKYEATGVNVNQNLTYYAKSDGKNNVTISYEGSNPGFIRWQVSTQSSPFYDESGLHCPDVWMKHILSQEEIIISSFIKVDDDYKASKLIDKTDNGKPFKDASANPSELATVCNDIPIYLLSSGVVGDNVTTKTYRELTGTATVTMSADRLDINLELPGDYSLGNEWLKVTEDKIKNCDKGLMVGCYETKDGRYGTLKYTCLLTTKDDELSNRTPVDENNKPATVTTVTKKIENTEITCTDLLPESVKKMLNTILDFIKYGASILVILLSIVDLVKTSLNGNQAEFKKAFQRFLKRLIFAVLLFFIKDIIYLILEIAGIASSTPCDLG